jgi:hypothetical protein
MLSANGEAHLWHFNVCVYATKQLAKHGECDWPMWDNEDLVRETKDLNVRLGSLTKEDLEILQHYLGIG